MNLLKYFFRRFQEKVLFADLDGTIIVTKSGKTFPVDCNDWQLKEGIVDALRKYNPTHLFIVSNQGGIEKGFVDKKEWMFKMFDIIVELQKILPETKIDFSFEVSNDKGNHRRKPNCGMLEEYYHDYYGNNDFNKRNAMMIGDASGLKGQFSDSDYQCAKNFGIKYLDVDYFIKWAHPCVGCKNELDCNYGYDEYGIFTHSCEPDYTINDYISQFNSVKSEQA